MIDAELGDTIQELQDELEALTLLREVYHLQAEGFIEIDEEGRCFPTELCPDSLSG